MLCLAQKFFREDKGAVLTETLIALPVLVLLTVGILEFGNMMWQRQQLQAGVKDAARYWARCRPETGAGATFMNCDLTTARLIAFTGSPEGGATRVPGWDDASELTLTPEMLPTSSTSASVVSAAGSVAYQATPWTSFVAPEGITMRYFHQTRYVGW